MGVNDIKNIQIKRSKTIYNSVRDLSKDVSNGTKIIEENNLLDGELLLFRYKTDKGIQSVLGKCNIDEATNNKTISLDLPPMKTIQIEKVLTGIEEMINKRHDFGSSEVKTYSTDSERSGVGSSVRVINEKEQITGVPLVAQYQAISDNKNYDFDFYFSAFGISAHTGNRVLRFIPMVPVGADDISNAVRLEGKNVIKNHPLGATEFEWGDPDRNFTCKFKPIDKKYIESVMCVSNGSRKTYEGKWLTDDHDPKVATYNVLEFVIPRDDSPQNFAYILHFKFTQDYFNDYGLNAGKHECTLILSRFGMYNAWSGEYMENHSFDVDYPKSPIGFERYYKYMHVKEDGSFEQVTFPYDTSKMESNYTDKIEQLESNVTKLEKELAQLKESITTLENKDNRPYFLTELK